MKALFPISVDSQRFSSEETIRALNNIDKNKYSEIIFLIVDGLQLYNKATLLDKGIPLKEVFKKFELKNDYYIEREKWLHNLRLKVSPEIADIKWTITNVLQISDDKYHTIYRNILISYLALDKFRHDIIETAKRHRSRLVEQYSKYDLELSIAYIIEEIAINLRLRVIEGISAEYYIGDQLSPLVNLYANSYDIDIFTLCGIDNNGINFEFYHFPKESASWVQSFEIQEV